MAGSPRDPGINVETLERLKWKLSIGKHELGPLWPLPSFSRGHGGVKNGRFWGQNQVTMARSPRDPGITLKLFYASNHIYMKRKTWFRASMTPAILLPCARGVKNGINWHKWHFDASHQVFITRKTLFRAFNTPAIPLWARVGWKIANFRSVSPRQPWIV